VARAIGCSTALRATLRSFVEDARAAPWVRGGASMVGMLIADDRDVVRASARGLVWIEPGPPCPPGRPGPETEP
jgi:hypothetical protein